jgi:quercetin dioxygenase-like cupin family protein
MKVSNGLWRALVIPLSFAGMMSLGAAAEVNPAAVAFKLPDQIKWSPADARGVQAATLVGDPDKPGFYVVLTKWLKGNHFSHPHFHPNDRYIQVLSGTWWVGTGPKFDPANLTVPMPAGSFVTHYGKQVHYDGAKDEEAWVLIVGEGPATNTPVEIAK